MFMNNWLSGSIYSIISLLAHSTSSHTLRGGVEICMKMQSVILNYWLL
jgi:hypothetical protein